MKIFTTYIAKLNKIALHTTNSIAFIVMRYKPNYLDFGEKIVWMPKVAPTEDLLSKLRTHRISLGEFMESYEYQICMDSNTIDEIEEATEVYDNIFLVCCEADADTCHRKVLGELLAEKGYEVEEYDSTSTLK